MLLISPATATGLAVKMEYATTAAGKNPVHKIAVEPETSLGEHAVQFINGSLVVKNALEYVLLGILKATIAGTGKRILAGIIILMPFILVTQYGIGFIYFLESSFCLFFVTRIFVRMVFESKLSEGTLNRTLAGVYRNSKNFIIVFHLT